MSRLALNPLNKKGPLVGLCLMSWRDAQDARAYQTQTYKKVFRNVLQVLPLSIRRLMAGYYMHICSMVKAVRSD